MVPGALGEHADGRLALELLQERSDHGGSEGLLGVEPIWSTLKELGVDLRQCRPKAGVSTQEVGRRGPALTALPAPHDVAAVAEPPTELELRAAPPRGSDQLFCHVFTAIIH